MVDQKNELLGMLKDSAYTVAILGPELLVESGHPNFIKEEDICEMESKYHDALVDLFSARFYETRTERFFKFYCQEIAVDKEPGEAYYNLAKLMRAGFIKEIITKDIYDLPCRAGCTGVVSLNGSIYGNYCQKCGRTYTLAEVLAAKGVPLCEKCKVKLRPNILLIGEMIDNSRMTQAAVAVEKADFLLVLGANLNEPQIINFIHNYRGNRLAVVNEELKFADNKADIALEGDCMQVIKELVQELVRE